MLGAIASALIASPAGAGEIDETRHWAPALSLSLDVTGQKARGRTALGLVRGPPLPDGCDGTGGQLCPRSNVDVSRDLQIRPNDASGDAMVAPRLGTSLELMTPHLVAAAGRPRLFARADLSVSFGFSSKLAGESAPGPFARPSIIAPGFRIPENTVLGQGSRAVAERERLEFSGGIGVALRARIGSRTFRLRPSFEYLRERLELSGVAHRAVALTENARSLDDFRFIELNGRRRVTYHGFGGGLEIEADSWHAGPIRSAVFLGGRLVHFFGDLTTTLRANNEFGETAVWRFEKGPWAWRGNAGIRLRWVPN